MSVPQSPLPWRSTHAFAESDRPAMKAMRAAVEPTKGKMRDIAGRPVFDDAMSGVIAPVGVTYREAGVDGVPGWWCEPAGARPDGMIVHLHGGWFNFGSAPAFRHFVGHIARSAGAKAFIPDYRLAPEHPFPAAIEDVRTTIDGLLALGFRSLAVTGDSAGGNLALSFLSLGSAASPQDGRIAGAVVFSPVTDLTLSGESWESRAEADPFFVRDQV